MSNWKNWKVCVLLLSGIGQGCSSDIDETVTSEGTEEPTVTTEEEALTTSPLVASLTVGTNKVEFYNYSEGTLVSESGPVKAGQKLKLVPGDTPESVWKRLSTKPVPEAIKGNRVFGVSAAATTSTGSDESGGGQALIPKSNLGCGNGCCDPDFLVATFEQCTGGDFSFDWQYIYYNWSFANGYDKFQYNGFVCGATGTSSYKVKIGGSTSIFSVQEATFRTHGWFASYNWLLCQGWCDKTVLTNVNSVSFPAPHTYCGNM